METARRTEGRPRVDQQPVVEIVELSDSFHGIWADLAAELGFRCTFPGRNGAPEEVAPAAIMVAAGGEEETALDYLLTTPRRQGIPLFLVAGRSSHRFAVEALRRGATDYFAVPGDLDLLRRTLAARVDAGRARGRRSTDVRAAAEAFGSLVGRSPALQATLEKAARVLPHGEVTVLITGETGTGKELLARALHDGGPRAAGPFVPVNCVAIPSELLESELFGHEKGAFTDARHAKPGLFEQAHGGTLFLDEVGHLPLHLQGKLLRALEDKRIRRVGGIEDRTADVRIVAATHVDLARAVKSREFREDLYYRLNVVSLHLPALRERGDDVELLAATFARSLAERYQFPVPTITPDVRAVLRAHPWPGNVRELRHAIERALLLSQPGTLNPDELVTPGGVGEGDQAALLAGTLDDIVAAVVGQVLQRHGGNKTAAARALGISRARLGRLLERPREDPS